MKYTEAILWNGTRKLLWFEIAKMLIAVLENKFIVLVIIIFGRLRSLSASTGAEVVTEVTWRQLLGRVDFFFLGGGRLVSAKRRFY